MLGRKTPTPAPSDTLRSKREDSFFDKLGGTLGRKKKQPEEQPPQDETNEVDEVEHEGRMAIDSSTVPVLSQKVELEEGEERRFMTRESREDSRVNEVLSQLIYWLNQEVADQRIVVKHLQEDLYDGQVLQKLLEKLANIRIEVPEVTQSDEGQKQKLGIVIDTANRILSQTVHETPKWNVELIHNKDLVAIAQLLVALALHFRAPIRFPEHVSVQVLIASRHDGKLQTRYATEQLTTSQTELGLKGERDAFDTLFDYGPDKLQHVKTSLLAFCNKHLNKINLEVSDLETQFQDGVFLILLLGLLEGYFVPLYDFHLQVASHEEKLRNVGFAFQLMEEANLPKPRSRVADIANGDLKSTLRLLHLLFSKYKHV